ncbi:MAG: replication-associated recombination protein A [Erysipelotrichaceae bacterium]|jgi:putative ATPase
MQQPLAIRLRPTKLDEVFGQQHLIGENMLLRRCVNQQQLFSMIFYGPPGSGKTTLALAIANELNLPYRSFSAVEGNKKDLVEIFEHAKLSNGLIVIIDEIHRLNKDKQDLLLPHIETGLITVIGATTSNPYFAINPAVRSRCHLLEVKPLTVDDVEKAIDFALKSEKGYKGTISIDEDAKKLIAYHSNGDLRYAYNLIEICAMGCFDNHIDIELVKKYSSMANMHYDHDEDGHYDAVSAFQKSIRGSDVNAALFYLSRLAMANDLDSIERRLLVIAYEDIGLANPAACARTVNALDAARRIGFPEALIPLGVAVIDLALSPKSRSAADSVHSAYAVAEKSPYAVPVYLRLNPVGLADEDKYDYSAYHNFHKIQYLPDELKDMEFYIPNTSSSYEKALVENYKELKKYYRTNKLKSLK